MTYCKPIKALLPDTSLLKKMVAPPYDVISRDSAKQFAKNNPYSWLHISKPEIDFEDTVSESSPQVLHHAKAQLEQFIHDGVLTEDATQHYYIYQLKSKSHCQTGIALALNTTAIEDNFLKTHEHTIVAKEKNRAAMLQAINAHYTPVMLSYNNNPQLTECINSIIGQHPILYAEEFDGVIHTLWQVPSAQTSVMQSALNALSAIYVADGHHRIASAKRVADCAFSVLFPAEQLSILAYQRILKGLHYNTQQLLDLFSKQGRLVSSDYPVMPDSKSIIGIYCDNSWYELHLNLSPTEQAAIPTEILQNIILQPLFDIVDVRTDKRIDFVGGINAIPDIEHCVNNQKAQCGLTVMATKMQEIIEVSDNNKVMPPKSTWFEPKLLDGLLAFKL